MAVRKGVVEAVSTKYGKFSVLLDDVWYATKMEWCDDTSIQKGDTVQFDDGGGKFLKKVKKLSGGSGGSGGSALPFAKSHSNLGVELGHASKLGMDMALASDTPVGTPEFYKAFIENTENVYKIMKSLRAKYEGGEEKAAPTPEVKVEKATVEEDIF